MSSAFRFDEFLLHVSKRQLRRNGEVVNLTARALDTLVVLVRNRGRVVSKDELIAAVWADVIVDENNVSQQISALRRALGGDTPDQRFIETIPRRGYCFVAVVEEVTGDQPVTPAAAPKRFPFVATAAVALVVAGAVLVGALHRRGQQSLPITQLAVMPLAATGAAASDDFRGGLSQEIGDQLRRAGIAVQIPEGSSLATPAADAILGGSIEHSPRSIRMTVHLDEKRTGRRLWSRTFETPPERFVELPAQVAQEVSTHLGMSPRARSAPARQVRFEAYDAYLKGRYHWYRRSIADFEKAVEHYRRAITIEPDYADAYAGLAMVLGFLDHEIEARNLARKALALDANQADLRAYLAFSTMHYDLNLELSRRQFEEALAIAPDSPVAHHWYAFFLSYTGQHDQALKEIQRARRLAPLSLVINNDVGVILLWAGRYEEAAQQFLEVLDLDPSFWNGHGYLAVAYHQLGRHEEALGELRKLGKGMLLEVPILVKLGRIADAQETLTIALRQMNDPLYKPKSYIGISYAYAALGDIEKAFEWLELAYRERDRDVITVGVDPRFAPLHGDPRFRDFLVRLNLRSLPTG